MRHNAVHWRRKSCSLAEPDPNLTPTLSSYIFLLQSYTWYIPQLLITHVLLEKAR